MKKYDLIIIGAGNLGTFHAYHALRAGKKVLMLEKDFEPVEATVRNFGQVVPSGQALDTWFEYGRQSLEIYAELQEKTDISARKNGSYYLASDEDELGLLEEAHLLFQERGYSSSLLNATTCLEKNPSIKKQYCRGALFFPQEFSVEPRLMVHKVRQYLINNLALEYLNNTTVVDCLIKNSICQVVTAKGEIFHSEKVAICNGRDFNALYPEIFQSSELVVCKLNMMSTVAIPEVKIIGNLLSGLSIRRYDSFKSCPSYLTISTPNELKIYQDKGIHLLFKQAPDGRIIIGDSHEYAPVREAATLDFSIDMSVNELILEEAKRIVHLPTWQIERYWAGYYSQTSHGGIFEYDIEEKIYISTGIGGKGMTTSPGYAKQRIHDILS